MSALSIAGTVFVQPWIWFTELLDGTGTSGVFLAAFAMFLSYKFLVAPILGSSGGASSDTADKRRKR